MDIPTEKITQPFQLLASWIVGMLILVWEFLHVCLSSQEQWLKISSLICGISLSIIFIWAIFTLQTKYRAEMQDSEHYQQIWLKKREQELTKSKTLNVTDLIKYGKRNKI